MSTLSEKLDRMQVFAPEGSHSALRTLQTHLKREVLRFLSVAGQTLLAPVVTATLYLLIFGVSLGSRVNFGGNVSYIQFVVPGLVLMGIINNAFANTSSSLFISKFLGSIQDLLITPLTPWQYLIGYSIAAMIRAMAVGGVILLVSMFFTGLPWTYPVQALLMALVSSLLFALFGLIGALFAKNFDTLSIFTNFLLMPLIYLGGLFYPVSQLPHPWNLVSKFNPLYYLIEGFRHAIVGEGEISFALAFGISVGISVGLGAVVLWMFKNSSRLRN
ncbi:MAG: ABC transporter permease [Bdellovibrionota bacterium]